MNGRGLGGGKCRHRTRFVAKAALGLMAILAATAAAPPAGDVRINDSAVYPESLSADRAGTLYIGSSKGIVYRAKAGAATAEPWVVPDADNGLMSLLGVLVDDRTHTLWLCSIPSRMRQPPQTGVAALVALDLATGKLKHSYPFPAPASACNDIAVAKDGSVFATDTPNGRILKLARGADALAVFAADDRLKGIDGIVFAPHGTLYVNNVQHNQLVRIERGPDGAFSGLTELTLSQPVAGPDGFRPLEGNRFLLAEGTPGRIDEVRIEGDRAEIRVLREGLMSSAAVVRVGDHAYAAEGKINYLIDPKLRGQDPGDFIVRAIKLDGAR